MEIKPLNKETRGFFLFKQNFHSSKRFDMNKTKKGLDFFHPEEFYFP